MKKLWSLVLFMGLSLSAMAGITVPKAGDIILQDEMAVVTIRSNAIGWHGKRVLVKAKVDFELENDVVEYGHFFKGGVLELQREATIAMGTTLPLMTKLVNGSFYVFHAASNEWVLHNFFKKFNKGHYIFGEKIETIARWAEAGGVAGALTVEDEEEYRLVRLAERVADLGNKSVSMLNGKVDDYYGNGTKVEIFVHPSGDVGYKVSVFELYAADFGTDNHDGGFVYFNSEGYLHREDGDPAVIARHIGLDSDFVSWNDFIITDLGEPVYHSSFSGYWLNGVEQL